MTAKVWCGRCKTRVEITGPRQISPTGIVRMRGNCPCCGLRLKALVGMANSPATA